MVLCHSRLMYVEFTVSQTMEHFLAAHEHAFAAFRGCPGRLMIDNLKSAVLAASSVKRRCSIPAMSISLGIGGSRSRRATSPRGTKKGASKTAWVISRRIS
jgi:transposase